MPSAKVMASSMADDRPKTIPDWSCALKMAGSSTRPQSAAHQTLVTAMPSPVSSTSTTCPVHVPKDSVKAQPFARLGAFVPQDDISATFSITPTATGQGFIRSRRMAMGSRPDLAAISSRKHSWKKPL